MNRLKLLLLGLLSLCGTASATVVDFNAGVPSSFTSYTQSGVTFTAIGGGSMLYQMTPNGTGGIIGSTIPRAEIFATISGGATSVAVDLGDFGVDADLIFLQIFDASMTSLGYIDQAIGAGVSGMFNLSLSAAGIQFAQFGTRGPSQNGSSVYADNFAFTAPSVNQAVPEPFTLTLVGLGLIGLYSTRRRKAK
jgi:hypothetical protein